MRVEKCGWGARLAPVVVFLLSAVVLSAGQAQPSSHSGNEKRMAQAVDRVVLEGVNARLPPHLSHLLGISPKEEEECLVTQRVVRSEKLVQGFDVSLTNFQDVVIFVVDVPSNDQTLYLTSPSGRLRRVVSVRSGVGNVRAATREDRKAFEQEKQFWLDRLAPKVR